MNPQIPFKCGEQLRCTWNNGVYQSITVDKIYTALRDQEPGTFTNWPYIRVKSDDGHEFACYASRFERVNAVLLSPKDWDTYINGGYIVVADPSKYPPEKLLTDGTRFCIWHRELDSCTVNKEIERG